MLNSRSGKPPRHNTSEIFPDSRTSRAKVNIDIVPNKSSEGRAIYLIYLKLDPHRGARNSIVDAVINCFRLDTNGVLWLISLLDWLSRWYFFPWPDKIYRRTKSRGKTSFADCHPRTADLAIGIRQKRQPASDGYPVYRKQRNNRRRCSRW